MNIIPQQIKQIHTLFSASGLKEQKANIILGFSHGRGESSKDLTDAEAQQLINYLQKQKAPDAANKMRRKIISLAYEMHWAKAGNWKAAVECIDKFCTGPHGIYKKELNKHSYQELVQLVSQFEMMYKKHLNKF